MSIIIKYPEHVYVRKIEDLDDCIGLLNGHLETLRDYKDQVKSNWRDQEGLKYFNLLSKEEQAVRNAMHRAESLKSIYSDAKQALNRERTAASDLLGSAEGLLEQLGIKGEG